MGYVAVRSFETGGAKYSPGDILSGLAAFPRLAHMVRCGIVVLVPDGQEVKAQTALRRGAFFQNVVRAYGPRFSPQVACRQAAQDYAKAVESGDSKPKAKPPEPPKMVTPKAEEPKAESHDQESEAQTESEKAEPKKKVFGKKKKKSDGDE